MKVRGDFLGPPHIAFIVHKYTSTTIKHLILRKSKFGDFNRLTYWRILILVVLSLRHFQVMLSFFKEATLKRNNMLPIIPVIIAPFKTWRHLRRLNCNVKKWGLMVQIPTY